MWLPRHEAIAVYFFLTSSSSYISIDDLFQKLLFFTLTPWLANKTMWNFKYYSLLKSMKENTIYQNNENWFNWKPLRKPVKVTGKLKCKWFHWKFQRYTIRHIFTHFLQAFRVSQHLIIVCLLLFSFPFIMKVGKTWTLWPLTDSLESTYLKSRLSAVIFEWYKWEKSHSIFTFSYALTSDHLILLIIVEVFKTLELKIISVSL